MTEPTAIHALRREADTLLRVEGGMRAIAAYERLVSIAPALPDAWFNLGYLHRRAGRWREAVAAYAEAIGRGVARPEEARLNRAAILSEHLFDADAAAVELREALAANPDFAPALLNLGGLEEDRGDRDAAREAYERALLVEPGHARALGRLAEIAAPNGLAGMLSRVDARLAMPVSDDDRAELLFARGRLLDRLDRPRDAFAAIARANGLARAAAPGWRYDAREREALVDAIMAEPRGEALETAAAQPPIFLCGMFRSGTTVLEQLLGAHSDLCAAGELDALPRLIAERLPRFPDGLAALNRDEVEAMRIAYLDAAGRLGCGGRIVIDKRPDNFLYIGVAKRLFPDARVLVTRRHPLDTVLSNYFLRFDESVAYSFGLEDAAHWLVQERRLGAHWARLFPGDVMEVDYDLLVADPAPVVAAVLRFLGLPPSDACLRFHERRATIRTPSGWQAREPLHARSSGRWRRYRAELGPAAAVLERAGLWDDGQAPVTGALDVASSHPDDHDGVSM